MHDHFRVLGLELDASHDHVKKAFRTLAKKWHPDKNRSPDAEDRFKEIKAAYDFLQSADRRDVHAADLRRHRARETTEHQQQQHEGRHEHHSHHHHQHDHHHHQGHGHSPGHHQHGHGQHQHQERQQQPDAAQNVGGRSTTAPPPPPQQKQQQQQQHHHDYHHSHQHKQEHRHYHHHHQTHQDAQENAGSRDGDWRTGSGSAGKKRTHYRFDRASRSPNASERDGGGFGQRRAKMDNASSFPGRARRASPTFEFTFDFMSFDPLIEDILNLRKMFDFAATAAADAAPSSPRPGSAQKKTKKKLDPFGNPLPDSVDPGIYDWSAPRAFSQNWADLGDPEFFCHYCGRVMAITLLRRHEPKCAKLGGARRTEFLDPQHFSDHETVIHRTRQKLAQRAQQQQQNGKTGEKNIECEQCGLSLDEKTAQTHRAQCKHQSHAHPSPRPPSHQQPATSTTEERQSRSGVGGGPFGGGWNSPRRHAHRRSASAHPHSKPPWNNNFSEDKVPDTPRSTGRGEDSGHERKEREQNHNRHSHHHRQPSQPPSKKSETPISSKGCDKCVARFGRQAGFFCSCSVSHLL